MKRHYWGYRICLDYVKYFTNELNNGRLRQGWGYDLGQDLRNMTVDEGAGKNKRMLKVLKGDLLLIPRLPKWDDVAIVEATEDWESGYRFSIDKGVEDFGHIFPAKYLRSFNRNSSIVSGNIRSTLHNIGRFWSIDHCGKDIEKILNSDIDESSKKLDLSTRFVSSINDVFYNHFDSAKFSSELYRKMTEQFQATEWEYALVEGLRKLFPSPFFRVERVGGTSEPKHGCDIIIHIPSLIPNFEYIIGIQVKDYEGTVSDAVIQQIKKADSYYNNESQQLIDKIVIITRADAENNKTLIQNVEGVKFIFAHDLQDILYRVGKTSLGITCDPMNS